jgi:hypothetical protein
MATHFLDPIGGNNANNGTNYSLRKKDALPTLAAGDTVRVISSPDPSSLGDVTFTNNSTLTLASGRTLDLFQDGTWSVAANVTAATNTARREGATSASLAIAAGFTTGRVGHWATGTKDCSGYNKLCIQFRSSIALADLSIFNIRLCDDTGGTSAVNTLTLPAIPAIANTWMAIVLDNGGALDNDVKSVALYASSDPGIPTILLDNIFATNDISTFGLISKTSHLNPDFSAGEDPWFPIRSIVGTTVTIDSGGYSSTAGTASPGYCGVTETVTGYYMEPMAFPPVAAASTAIWANPTNGTAGNLVTISGGWDRTNMSTQPSGGLSWMTTRNSTGLLMTLNASRTYQKFERLGWVRGGNMMFTIANGASELDIESCHSVGSVQYLASILTVTGRTTLRNCSGVSSTLNGVLWNSLGGGMYDCRFFLSAQGSINSINGAKNAEIVDCKFADGTISASVVIANASLELTNIAVFRGVRGMYSENSNLRVRDITVTGATTAGWQSAGGLCEIHDLTTTGNSIGFDFIGPSSNVFLHDWTYDEASPATFATTGAFFDSQLISVNDDGVSGAAIIRTDGGTIESQTAVRHTASGIAWKMSPTSTDRSAAYPLRQRIGHFLCTSGVSTTIAVWLRRTHADLSATLRLVADTIGGVTSDVTDSITVSADTWENISINFTSTETGYVDVWVECYGGTTHSLYWDDLTFSPDTALDASSGDYADYRHGVLVSNYPASGGSPVPKYFPSSR